MMGLSDRIERVGSASPGWKTDLFSNSFSTVINAVIRVVVHIRVCNENMESTREGILRVRSLPSYLAGHLREMPRISPHPMNENLLAEIDLQSDRVEAL
jgi:hypothetical protein